MGNSRCATIAAAYLMIKKDYSATQALQYMRNSRLVMMKMAIIIILLSFTEGRYDVNYVDRHIFYDFDDNCSGTENDDDISPSYY